MKKNFILIVLALFFFASQVPVYAGQGKGNGDGKGQGVNKQLRLRDGSCGRTRDMNQLGSRQKQKNRSQVVQKDCSEQPTASNKSNESQR